MRSKPKAVADDDLLEAHDLWMAGHTLAELAASLGISSGSLHGRFVSMGLPRKYEHGWHRQKGLPADARYGLYILWCMR